VIRYSYVAIDRPMFFVLTRRLFAQHDLVGLAVTMTISKKTSSTFPIRLVVLTWLVLLVVIAAGCGDSASDSADAVFSADVNGNVDIYKISADSDDPIRLTTAVGIDFAPAWSPNKDQIAFMSDRNGGTALWVMDSEGESKRLVTSPDTVLAAFRWSPDSTRIGLEVVNDAVHGIVILDTESDESVSLTSPFEDVRIGDWSPDGDWVVYSAIEGDGSGIRRRNPTGVDEITLTVYADSDPHWSRNGQFIAFKRETDDGSFSLVVMDKDGENVKVVASGILAVSPFDWSPDSKQLVFVSELTGNAEIYVTGRDGKDTRQLTSNRVVDMAPLWSGDGASILFLSDGDGSFNLYGMDKNGEQQVRKTSIANLKIGADW